MHLKRIPPFIALLLVPYVAFTQNFGLKEYRGELGAALGATTYFGQIGGGTNTYRGNFGFYYRKIMSDHIAVRINYEYIPLGAKDSISSNPEIRQRGFEFFRPFHDIGFSLEYFFKSQELRYHSIHFNPYIGIGMSYILNVPNDYNNFKTYKFRIEKLQDQYAPIATIPLNLGFQYSLKNNLIVFSEITYRYTTADIIDNFGNSDAITTKNGTFKPAKNGNDRFVSYKIGISRSIVKKY